MKKNALLIAIISAASLLIMIIIDYFLKDAAELLNAWRVIEKLLAGRPKRGN